MTLNNDRNKISSSWATVDEIAEEEKKPTKERLDIIEDLGSRVKDAENKIEEINQRYNKLEKNIEKSTNFIMFIVGVIAVGFVFTLILISLDYFNNNELRYEKFIDKTIEIEKNLN